MIQTKLEFQLRGLLDGAKIFGLQDDVLTSAEEFFYHNEFGLCFDTIVTQMYEHEIEINTNFYDLIQEIGSCMKLPIQTYAFMNELIR